MIETKNDKNISAEIIPSGEDKSEIQKNPKRRREIIKTILIIFLAVMLILTFFSNTIMNRSLPEVSTGSVTSGKLTERVRGSGIVESNQVYEVTVDGNRVIDTIYIKAGQEVEKDTVLFTVSSGDSTELEEAQSTLEALELEYQKALLTVPTDYSAENQAIKNAREDLNTAIAKRDAAAASQSSDDAALQQYNSNKQSLEQKSAEQAELQTAIAAIDIDDYTAASIEYTGNLPALYNKYITAENAYATAYELYAQISSEGGDAAAAKTEADSRAAERDEAKAAYEAEKSSVRESLAAQLSTIDNEIAGLTSEISAYESSQQSESSTSLEELEADVVTKQRALEDLIIALEKTKTENDVNSQITDLDTEAKKAEIEKQKEKVEKLQEECEETEIKSKYSGVVSSVNVQPGETTVPDTAIAVIDISSEGYTVEITVDGEKTKNIKVGTEAEVLNNLNGDIQAVVSDIKSDTVSGSKNKILVFDVTGDTESGSNIDLSIPCGSGTYDAIVPKSAVYEDKNGKFVLVVSSKSSPLGNRYYAERVNVEVLASDESSCAVSGDISAGDYVITAASKPVSPNDQVRMKE
ncbi:MAG: RND transporter [Ruminococcus sp.]|nr:RND transporter [Ruminococcus sp.]